MSQHDMDVANGGGATVRADVNSALLALASLSSGATAPAAPFANMLWVDTTLHVLKQRNEANSAWRIRDRTDVEGVLAKTANYTALARDFGKLIDCTSGTFTLALTPAATLTDGWWIPVRNSGTGIVTIDPDSSEQIDGAATIALGPGESCLVYGNGTLFRSLCRNSISGLAEDTTPDTAADFVRTFDASANAFKKVKLTNLVASSAIVSGTPLVKNPFAVSSVTTQAHGLAGEPTSLKGYIECLTAEFGYSIGNRIRMEGLEAQNGTIAWGAVLADATNVVLVIGANSIQVPHKTTQVANIITSANWKFVIQPYYWA